MAAIFSITASTNTVRVGAARKATATYTVTNLSGRSIPARALAFMPDDRFFISAQFNAEGSYARNLYNYHIYQYCSY